MAKKDETKPADQTADETQAASQGAGGAKRKGDPPPAPSDPTALGESKQPPPPERPKTAKEQFVAGDLIVHVVGRGWFRHDGPAPPIGSLTPERNILARALSNGVNGVAHHTVKHKVLRRFYKESGDTPVEKAAAVAVPRGMVDQRFFAGTPESPYRPPA